MERRVSQPRPDWQRRVESHGLHFHSCPVPYWNESACYHFSAREIDILEQAANDLHAMCLEAVTHVIRANLSERFQIPEEWVGYVTQSWEADAPAVYGRFDLAYDGAGPPKLLE